MKPKNKVLAVLWDFDGTIVDSRKKNFSVTQKLMNDIVGSDSKKFSVLNSLEDYHSAHTQSSNWREFYRNSFDFTEEQVSEAGRLWTEYQLIDQTPVPIINGISETIKSLREFPQGIVSQNSKEIIIRYLNEKDISKYFHKVVGYEEVHITRQKPFPDGLLFCIDRLTNSESGYIFYIGDHETDAICVKNANDVLSNKNPNLKIISVGAFYGYEIDTSGWSVLADYEVDDAREIPKIIDNFRNGNNQLGG